MKRRSRGCGGGVPHSLAVRELGDRVPAFQGAPRGKCSQLPGEFDNACVRALEASLDEFLASVDWRAAFGSDDGKPLDAEDIGRLIAYYQVKFADIGPVYLAELMSTEFMTELRGRGDIVFSDRLLDIGRNEPELWKEIRSFFRRKEFATAMLVNAHQAREE